MNRYTNDPFNLPEKLYRYIKANYPSITKKDVNYGGKIFEILDNLDQIPSATSVSRTNMSIIPRGRDPRAYSELADLLQTFCFDKDIPIDQKREILSDIGLDVIWRLEQEIPTPAQNSDSDSNSNSNNSIIERSWQAMKKGGARKTRRHHRHRRRTIRRRVQHRRK